MSNGVSGWTTAMIVVSGVIAIGLPVVLFWHLRRRSKVSAVPLLLGAAAFVVFVFVLEVPVSGLLQRLPWFPALVRSPFFYTLYGALMAGIFEESGRFLTFRYLLKKHDSLPGALAYGIGHGGCEAVLLVGLNRVLTLMFIVIINIGGAERVRSGFFALLGEAGVLLVDTLLSTSPFLYLMGGLERVSAIAFHIAVSVIVWMAASRRGPLWLYPLAIGMHTLLNMGLFFYNAGLDKSLWPTELIVAGLAACACIVSWKLYNHYHGPFRRPVGTEAPGAAGEEPLP